MISKTITYENFDGKKRSTTEYFHISKNVITENMDLKDEFESLAHILGGEKRELTPDEIQHILQLIKRLIKLGYGKRSEDGEQFEQSKKIYKSFHDSAAYDALLWGLFTDPENAIAFMKGILPTDLVKQAEQEMAARGTVVPQDRQPKQEKQGKKAAKKAAEVKPVAFDE